MKLLIVEDNTDLTISLSSYFKTHAIDTEIVTTAFDAMASIQTGVFDAVVLDIELDEGSGYDVIESLRKQGSVIPVVVISAYSEIDHRIKGLDLGADDYVTKPFDNSELLARVKAILRRPRAISSSQLCYKSLCLDVDRLCATRNGVEIPLRKKECQLLEYLLINKGLILTRFQLLDRVWGIDSDVESNKVDVHIKNLRKLVDSPFEEGYIKTVRGVGYVLR